MLGRGELLDAGATVEGFPEGPSNLREVVLGESGPGLAGEAVRLNLSCIDSAGHSQIRSNHNVVT
jgi:hypothetical protein